MPQITAALDIAGEQGMGLPVVYNSSGYEKVETLKLLEGYVDVYLPDYKYADPLLAQQFSHAADYPEFLVCPGRMVTKSVQECCGMRMSHSAVHSMISENVMSKA